MEHAKQKRIMITAPFSGAGKTLVSCGLMSLMKGEGLRVAAFKCGPDYIDPMFHRRVLGVSGRNLDSFLAGPEMLRKTLRENSVHADIAVIEGAMGYYDGLSAESTRASASDIAVITGTPVILVVDAGKAARSVLPVVRGFLEEEGGEMIRGVLLNRLSAARYPGMKKMIESELPVSVAGYLPKMEKVSLESRHLGLMMPEEVADLQEQIDTLRETMRETVDLSCLLEIAAGAESIPDTGASGEKMAAPAAGADPVRIAVARDEAFCFLYEDNLDMLQEAGAELIFFSPVHDEAPPEADAMILCGGYPELYARQLSENTEMRGTIRSLIRSGMPTAAECGGFLYLQQFLTDTEGKEWPMAGIFEGGGVNTGKLRRFGYVTLKEGSVFGQQIGPVRAHEFHYYDTDDPGEAFLAEKPSGKRSWRCIHSTDTLLAGFPHLYYPSNPRFAEAFLTAAEKYRQRPRAYLT